MKNKSPEQARKYSRLNLFIRSSIFSSILVPTCILYSLICILSTPLSLYWRSRIARWWIIGMVKLCKIICHIDYQIEGLQNLKKAKTPIVMSKHQSAWEAFYLTAILPEAAIITKRELMWVPFFGWAFNVLKPISINRSNKKSAMQQLIEQGKVALDQGRPMLIFPEGTRIPAGKVGHYKLGGARLSEATGYPIVPVAHNAGRYWPRRQFIKIPGTVRLCFGPPIYPQGKTAEEILALTKDWIENKMTEIDR